MAANISKSVNIAINVINGVTKQVSGIEASLKKIEIASKNVTKSLGNLNKSLGSIKAPKGLKDISTQLKSLSNISSKGLSSTVTELNSFSKMKFPSFTSVNSDLKAHALRIREVTKAYKQLSVASKSLNLKSISSSAVSASKSIDKIGKSSKKTGASFSQWGYALGSASTGLSKFGTQIYGVTRGFSAVSKGMAGTMATFTAAFTTLFALKGVISDLVEFDDAIRAAGAVSKASSVELIAFSDAARKMGETTRYTATDAANALKALAMTGLSVTDAIATLPTVLNLAASANMDLGESADIVTNIMVGYGKTIQDLPRIADLMTAAFTSSNTTLQQLGTALKYVGPVAKAAGQSLEETTVSLALLANAGYRGSKAGTALRTAFTRLLSPTEKMSKALKQYEITSENLTNPDGTMKSFTSILELMRQKSISAGDAITIFGKRAGPGMLSLLGQSTSEIEKMTNAIANSRGVSLKTAYEMENGLGGTLRILKSAWQELSLTIGKAIEQNVTGSIKDITNVLRDNKDSIADVVVELMNFILFIGKAAGGVLKFIAENAKLISSITALALAGSFLNTVLGVTVGLNITGVFSALVSGNILSKVAMGIRGVTSALVAYNVAGRVTTGMNLAAPLVKLEKISYKTVGQGLKGVGLQAAFFTKQIGGAIAKAVTLHPVLAAIVIVAGSLAGAFYLLNESYEENAQSATNVANGAEDSRKKLQYQLAELGLISGQFDEGTESSDGFSNAQQRLIDVINSTNTPMSKRIELLNLTRSGIDGAKEAQEQLNDIINEQDASKEIEIVKERIKAEEEMAKAVEEHAKKLQIRYGVVTEGAKELSEAEQVMQDMNEKDVILQWLQKKMGWLEDELDVHDKLLKKQKLSDTAYKTMISTMIVGGKTLEDFTVLLNETGESSEVIEKLTNEFDKLSKKANSSAEEMKKLAKYTNFAASAEAELSNRESLAASKQAGKERIAVKKQTLLNIAVLEAQGTITHEQAEMAKLSASMDAAQGQVDIARNAYEKMNADGVASAEKGRMLVIQAEESAATARLAVIQKIATSEEAMSVKLANVNVKLNNQKSKNNEEYVKYKKTLDLKEEKAKNIKSAILLVIEENLKTKLEKLDKKLSKSREKFSKSRVKIEQSVASAIAAINASTADKLRAIRQRDMTDAQKERDNEKTANEKLQKGVNLIEEARRSGDMAMLERGKQLITQSSELSSGLKDERDAINGIEDASDALKSAEEARGKIALDLLQEKQDASEKEIKNDKEIAKTKAEADETAAKRKFTVKMGYANDFYNDQIAKEDETNKKVIANLESQKLKYQEKIDLLGSEKQLILDIISEQEKMSSKDSTMLDVFEGAKKSTDDALESIENYSKAIEEIKDKTIDIKFTGTASPTLPLGEKLEEIQKKLTEIDADITIDVKFVDENNVSLSDSLNNKKKEVESVKITLPVDVNMEKVNAVSEVIDELKNTSIKINIEIDTTKLNSAIAAIKSLQNKTVTLIVNVSGMDQLVRAKNLIDSIKSKTVVVTTKYVEQREGGGLIGGPEQYADGGHVFKRLQNQYINKGSGTKDDVPALLMKGEVVQKVSAVKKYGKDFMLRLNAGLVPTSVVDKYADGGHVGYKGKSLGFLPEQKRKKIFSIFGNKASNTGNDLNASTLKTEIGESSLEKMSSSFNDVVSAFNSGGSVNDTVSQFTKSGADVDDSYIKSINTADKAGDVGLADTLRAEREQVAELTKTMKNDLYQLQLEYNNYIKKTTGEYSASKREKLEAFNDETGDNKLSFDKDNEDDGIEFDRNKYDYNSNRSSALREMDKELLEVLDPSSEFSYGSNLEKISEAQSSINEYISKLNKLGTALPLALYSTEDGESHAMTTMGPANKDKGRAEWINGIGEHHPMRGGIPDFSYFERIMKNPLANETQVPAQYSEIISGLHLSMSNLESSIGKKFNLSSNGETSSWAFREYKDYMKSNPAQDIAKSVSRAQTQKERNRIIGETKNELDSLKYDFSLVEDDYDRTMSDRKFDYSNNLFDLKKAFRDSSIADELAYNTGINESKSEYVNNSRNIKDNYVKNVNSIRKESESIKNGVESDGVRLSSNLSKKDQLEMMANGYKTGLSSADSIPLEIGFERESMLNSAALRDTGSSIKDETMSTSRLFDNFIKKYKIPGYNIGGFVKSTANSIAGKDSILANLTPEEYVIKAPVVRKFGKGFFDSINNFKVPQFNTGGYVSNLGDNMVGDNATGDSVRHIVDLSINNSKTGELSGSPMTVNKFLNDMALAKLRS